MSDNGQALRIAAIRERVTIFDVFEAMGLDEPAETHQMRCPFHDDHSPSARVYADQNKLYCFTCQRTWDVIDAVQTHWQLTFADALVWLEERFGVAQPGARSLTGTIRSQLTTKVEPSIEVVVQSVEDVLISLRAQLGFQLYSRLLYALDLSAWELSERKIKTAEFQTRMSRLLETARGHTVRGEDSTHPDASGTAPSLV